MARLEWCVPCGINGTATKATHVVEEDPMCAAHALAAEPSPLPMGVAVAQRLCSRGCGKPCHRGRCAGLAASAQAEVRAVAAVPEVPAAVPVSTKQERRQRVDRLIAEEVSLDAVPADVVRGRHPIGRSGELWVRFQALRMGVALKVKCRDIPHVGQTDRQLRKRVTGGEMRDFGIDSKRVGLDYFCWKVGI
jgi:hypothetical protein